jgi:tRNA nucleotidyltransferase (CCA-adding enzyme)
VVRDLARAVRNAGGRALIVGGFVRDSLLAQASARSPEPKAQSLEPEAQSPMPKAQSQKPKAKSQDPLDIDLEVFGIAENRLTPLLEQFGRVEAVGASFPVYKLRVPDDSIGDIDVALPRRESKSGR